MTLRDLEIFCAVCDTNNMTDAARQLHISQSSISQVIANIEKEYNIRLFERLAKKLYITESGRLLQNYAKHVLFSFHELNDELRGSSVTKTISIGASATIGTCLLPAITKRFSIKHPAIVIKATVDNTSTIEDQLLKNNLDLALVEGNVHSPHITAIPFLTDELVLVCGRPFPLCQQKSIEKKELSNLPFVIREQGSGTRELFNSVMNANGISWSPIWTCNHVEAIKNAVKNGIGVTVISRMLLKKEIENGDLHVIEINEMNFMRNFKIIYHCNKYLSEPLLALIDLIQNTAHNNFQN